MRLSALRGLRASEVRPSTVHRMRMRFAHTGHKSTAAHSSPPGRPTRISTVRACKLYRRLSQTWRQCCVVCDVCVWSTAPRSAHKPRQRKGGRIAPACPGTGSHHSGRGTAQSGLRDAVTEARPQSPSVWQSWASRVRSPRPIQPWRGSRLARRSNCWSRQ